VTGWQYADVWDTAAAARGDQTALVHGDRRVSWRDFTARAGALAAALVAAGAQRGDRIALHLRNCPEYLELTYAAYKAALTPVNTNYRYRAEELADLWSDADAVAVAFHGAFTESVEDTRPKVGVRHWIWVDDGTADCPGWAVPYERLVDEHLPADGPGADVAPWGRTGDDIVMIYTGGTTGTPKGVMWRHDDLYRSFNTTGDPEEADLAAVRQRLAGGGPGPVGVPASPLMHATGSMFAHSMLTQGGTVVTVPGASFDAAALLDTVARERADAMAIVGDAFGVPLLDALDAEPGRWDLSSLTLVVSAGVMWSAATKAGLAHHLPGALLVDLLGSTEAHGLGSAVAGGGAATGRFRLGPHAMVLASDGRRVEPGETGLLAVGGPSPLGYHKDAAKSAATFRLVDGVRVSIPGDWARLEHDGTITLLGRGSLCINTGGEKVFPEEVEEALETHPAVRDSTVVGIPDARLGEVVAAAVELHPAQTSTTDELIAHVRARLAGYKAPRVVVLVDSVGRAPSGKADYAGTRQRILAHLQSVPSSPAPP